MNQTGQNKQNQKNKKNRIFRDSILPWREIICPFPFFPSWALFIPLSGQINSNEKATAEAGVCRRSNPVAPARLSPTPSPSSASHPDLFWLGPSKLGSNGHQRYGLGSFDAQWPFPKGHPTYLYYVHEDCLFLAIQFPFKSLRPSVYFHHSLVGWLVRLARRQPTNSSPYARNVCVFVVCFAASLHPPNPKHHPPPNKKKVLSPFFVDIFWLDEFPLIFIVNF